ncbi:MAG: reverse transcriptase domain-containing protein [Pirellulales bacterium]
MSMETGFGFVIKHRGPYTEYRERYEMAAADAWDGGDQMYDEFCSRLPTIVSDERNLGIALDYLQTNGGPAPGPDGQRILDIDRMTGWPFVRDLRDLLRSGTYVRGQLRRCLVEKRPGSAEKRTIWVQDAADRVVSRGAAQILVPLLDPVIDEHVYSWRRRGTLAALAYAVQQVMTEGRTIWITEDLRNAFDEVPRARLRQILRHYVPNDEFCCLVDHLAARPSRRGILQGSPLSPPLLDLYLSHLLHRGWRRAYAHPPLLTYVDDLWIGCRPVDDSVALYRELVAAIRAAGMRPKLGAEWAITDIRRQAVTWLGYRLRMQGNRLVIRSAHFAPTSQELQRHKHQLLVAKFARLHERFAGWRDANTVIRGIVGYLAPTLPFEDPQRIYDLIAQAAAEAGFREIWTFDEVLDWWQAGHERWLDRVAAPQSL